MVRGPMRCAEKWLPALCADAAAEPRPRKFMRWVWRSRSGRRQGQLIELIVKESR
jgi:hypothetical protein